MCRNYRTSRAGSRAARRSVGIVAAVFGLAFISGCLPYPVGTTAQPVPVGTTRVAASTYFIPNAVSLHDEYDSTRHVPPAPLRGTDFEYRRGIDSVSDLAIHLASFSGFVVDYKRKLDGLTDTTAAATALMLGAGIVNFGDHAYGEVGVMHSGAVVDGRVAYGGLRVMQVVPIAPEAVSDRPTAGGYLGIRLPFGDFDVSPELGVYYDHSALGVRRGDLLIVPSLTFGAIRRPRRAREAAAPRPPIILPPAGTVWNAPAGDTPSSQGARLPRKAPQKPSASGPVAAPSGARPIPTPTLPRATASVSRRGARRPARP